MNSVIKHIPLVKLTRGGIVESVHTGSAVLVDTEGKVIFEWGDVHSNTYLRSSAKPFQALAFLEHGGAQHYGLSLKEVAILCSSHTGSADHLLTLQGLQEKIGISETQLQCGLQFPRDQESARQLILSGEKPTANYHNCSGKHSGMLAFAKMIGAPLDSYLDPQHPVQQAILKTFSEVVEVPVDDIQTGMDGCSAPVFAIPLRQAALGFARFSQPAVFSSPRAEAAQLIWEAMTTHPEMIAGNERFDTEFMRCTRGSAISKHGAEGFLGMGLRGGMNSHQKAMGLAIKIEDGDVDMRASPVTAMAILKHIHFFSDEQVTNLASFDQRPLHNWRGLEVGEIRPAHIFSDSPGT